MSSSRNSPVPGSGCNLPCPLHTAVATLKKRLTKKCFLKCFCFRAAKRHMDEKSFYGGVLHVCYVPEYETVEDTRLKLQDRRRYVIRAVQNKGTL